MKKSALLVLFLIIIIASAGTFAYFYIFRKPAKSKGDGDGDDDDNGLPPTPGLVIIYTNSTIYGNITSEIAQYKQDIINQGYSVKVYNWSQPTELLLKGNLTAEYTNYGLEGAILVGEFPYILFQNLTAPPSGGLDPWGPYPCDLFFMDLDGKWEDLFPPSGIYDGHTVPTLPAVGDLEPEIWISRINPNPLSGVNQTKALKKYFKRNHEYRIGQLTRPHKALLYIDDDWADFVNEWVSNFTAYTDTSLFYYYDKSTTNPTYYKNNLSVDYEWVHLLCHSNETDHLFGMDQYGNPLEGVVNTTDIKQINTQPLFYNLYACYNGNYTHKDSLGTQYLFSNNTLTVICSARSGGMDLYQPFYDALKQGKPIGEAFRIWFHNPEMKKWNKWTEKVYYGMTILGDPLLTIYM